MKTIFLLIGAFFSSLLVNGQVLVPVHYQDGEQKLKGMTTSTTGEGQAGVLILPAWNGIDNEAKQAALDLASLGYIAFIADIYGEGNTPTDNPSAAKIAGSYKSDFAKYQERIALALEQLIRTGVNQKKVAIIGFCFGGTGALEAARGNLPVQGVVSIHGGLGKDSSRPASLFSTKILIENPANDASVTPEIMNALVQELNDGKADWQIITYSDSKHTFTNPESADYNPVMAKRAWEHTLLFLKEVLE